jgi:hypothetical protein
MTRRLTLLLLSALLIPTATAITGRAESVYNPPDCGTNALFLLMKLEGVAVGLNEIQSALPPPHEFGYSMLELQSAGQRCGLNLVGRTFGPAGVPLSGPVIAYRPGHKPASGHFVVLRPVGSSNTVVQVIDPPYAPRVIDYPALFGGTARPVMILRPTTRFERWAPLAWVLLLAVPCLILLRATGWIRHRTKRPPQIGLQVTSSLNPEVRPGP